MTLLPLPGQPSTRRELSSSGTAFSSAAALILLVSAGCASPRLPRPPSLNLPQLVQDLTAQRDGGQVILHWTTPARTTDRLAVKGPITAQLCRIEHPEALPSSSCVTIARTPASPGASHAADLLPPTLTSGPPLLLAYRVQLFNAHGRTAGLSPQAFAAAGAAPPQVEQLRATPAPSGIVLEWQRQNIAAPIELERELLNAPGSKPRSSNPSNPSAHSGLPTKARSFPRSPSKPAQTAPPPPNQVTLRTAPRAPDPGGTIDATPVKGETYRYTAQRVLSTSLDGHILTLHSLPSAPVTVVMRDIFPPAVPTGLEAVPDAATAAGGSSIDLSWTPDTDLDLAGYIVYRQGVSPSGALTGSSVRLNQTPSPSPAWRDQTAVTGQRYAYRVTAVDASGNESAPSADVQETLRQP